MNNPFSHIASGTGRRLICLEVNPPRGTDLSAVFARLDGQLDNVDLLNVTDSALARMKLAALPFGAILKQRYGKEVVVNISCRDRNLVALEGDLLAGWVTGIRSVVALTGDAMTIGDTPERKGVFEINSVGLLNLLAALNRGSDMAGHPLKGKTEYFPGAVVNPNVKNIGAEIKRLKRKGDAGARYALSQPVFDPKGAKEFLLQAKEVGVPIFIGLMPYKSAKSALAVNAIPGIKLPEALTNVLNSKGDEDLSQFSIDHALELALETRELVCGFHVISGGAPHLALKLAQSLRSIVT